MTTTHTAVDETAQYRKEHRTRTVRVPRTRGAISGLLLVVLGAWGAVIPFIGPYFDYAYASDETWKWTAARFWLEVLPGAAVALGGLLVLTSVNRIVGSAGAWLAAAGGAWFVVGPALSSVVDAGSVGTPTSNGENARALAELGYFYGIGAVIIFLAAFALGRLAVVGLRDIRLAEKDDARAARAREAQLAQAREAEAREAQAREAEARDAAEGSGNLDDNRGNPTDTTPLSPSVTPTQVHRYDAP